MPLVAWIALEVAVAALIRAAGRAATTALSAMLALSIVAELGSRCDSSSALPLDSTASARRTPFGAVAARRSRSLPWCRYGGSAPWSRYCAASRCNRGLRPRPRRGLWVALLAVSAVVPHAPVFVARDFDIRTANLWEALHARLAAPNETGSAEAKRQRSSSRSTHCCRRKSPRLAPPTKGATNIYALGIAGWADQDVFLKELDGGLAAIGAVLPIRGHTLRLVNHRETQQSLPLANQRNFAAAVHAVGEVMNKDEDILLLLHDFARPADGLWAAPAHRVDQSN